MSKALCGEPWPKGPECLLLLCMEDEELLKGTGRAAQVFSQALQQLLLAFFPCLLLLLSFPFLLSQIHTFNCTSTNYLQLRWDALI